MSESKLIENPDDIRLTDNEEIEAIMGHPPGWLLRSGNVGILLFITILLIMGFYYKYPDVVQTKVVLMSDSPPVRIAPLTNGRMVYLTDQTLVREGDLIAVLENASNWEDVFYLKEELVELSNQLNDNKLPKPLTNNKLELGSLQADFGELNHWLNAYKRFRRRDRTAKKIDRLDRQIEGVTDLNSKLLDEEASLRETYEEETKIYNRADTLFKSGNISENDLNKSKIRYLEAERNLKKIKSSVKKNDIQMEILERDILELKDRRSITIDDTYLKAAAALQKLKGGIEAWEQRFLIKSPLSGQLYMPNVINKDQYLKAGEPIFTIIPSHSKVYGRAKVGQENFGKIKLNAIVKLRLFGFPYQDFGAVEGTVIEIDPLPEGGLYGMKIDIPSKNISQSNDTLYIVSTFDKKLAVKQEMTGIGNVITKKRTFLERIFDKLRATWES